ncbi:MAG UNVERIFIED_CONTAM: hypothetical protein LVR29_02310 [Microcystis novacekii LVE1205-3]
MLDREGAWGIFYIVSSEEPHLFTMNWLITSAEVEDKSIFIASILQQWRQQQEAEELARAF